VVLVWGPLVVIGFVAIHAAGIQVAGEHPAGEDAQARARTEDEFGAAEAYEGRVASGGRTRSGTSQEDLP
jgi:hypothetical protein